MEVAREGMRKFVIDQPDTAIRETPLAQELARLLKGDENLFVYCSGNFWAYDRECGVYSRVARDDLLNLLFELQGEKRPNGKLFDITKSLAEHIISILGITSHDNSFFNSSNTGICVPQFFVSFVNGQIELDDHSPSNRVRTFIPISYDERAELTKLDAFFYQTLRDPDLVSLIYEFYGVALFGLGTKYQVAAILIGEGANGKGVVTELIERLVPAPIRSAVSPNELNKDYERDGLVGSILNVSSEVLPSDKSSWEWVKKFIAGETPQQLGTSVEGRFNSSPPRFIYFLRIRFPSCVKAMRPRADDFASFPVGTQFQPA